MHLRLVVSVRCDRGRVLRAPLVGASRALFQFPFELEQGVEEVVVPLGRRLGPGHFEAAADGIATLAGAVLALPAKTLILDRGCVRRRADQRGVARAVGLAEGVAAGDQRHGFLVVHRHAEERLTDVLGRRHWIRCAVRPFRVDVDQAHLHGRQRLREFAFAAVALVAEPGAFRPPEQFPRLPFVGAAAGVTEGLEPHRFQRGVAREHIEVCPGNLAAVFLLDRPQQTARAIEQHVVRPRIQRRETLLAAAGAAAPVSDAIGAGAMPRHADHQAAVVAEVGRPPILRVGHQRLKIGHDGVEIERLELGGVVERLAHRVGQVGMAMQNLKIEQVRPPFAIARSVCASGERALAGALVVSLCVHGVLQLRWMVVLVERYRTIAKSGWCRRTHSRGCALSRRQFRCADRVLRQ